MSDGWHITAQDIVYWADTSPRRAQELLPLLIQRLVLASTDCSSLHFPNGESISKKGWDGTSFVETGNPFVPSGKCVWELSTDKKIGSKANNDYKKRTDDSKGEEKNSTTFMFATFRLWPNKSQWEKKKKADIKWKDVKAFDADDLKAWIELCPAVHRWFAKILGKRPSGVLDVEQAWDSWSLVTSPASTTNLVIAGRDKEAKEIINQLQAQPKVIRIRSESREESYAFALAVMQHCLELQSRCLIIHRESEWEAVVYSKNSLILLPQYDNPGNIGLAVQQGHHVIIPQSRTEGVQQDVIDIGLAVKSKLVEALTSMGLAEDDAKTVVRSCRGYLKPLRRHARLNPHEKHMPAWEKSENATSVITVLLAGGWSADNQDDCLEIAELSGLDYGEFEQKLYAILSSCDDPSIRRVGNVWQIFSRHDAWALLSKYINPVLLKRFCDVTKKVLRELDPRFEISPDERWMANIKGKKTNCSGTLRQGLTESIAILGGYGDQDCQAMQGESIQDRISILVRDILVEGMSGWRWWSLSGELPLLGEAAPEIFLDAVEEGLEGDNPALMELFVEEGTFGGCSHSGLLWALEGISWNLQYLSRVVLILGKLSRLDPGGTYANRPFNSLKEIFLGWKPQTKASLEERIRIFSNLMKSGQDVCWKLLLALLPNRGGDISTQIHKPYFRNWTDGWEESVTKKDYYEHILAVSQLCLTYVEEEPDKRWPDFIEEIPSLPNEPFEKALDLLNKKNKQDFSATTAIQVCNKLRDIISSHRKYAKAEWALPKETIGRLLEIQERFIPDDVAVKYQYLFDNHTFDLVEPEAEEEDFNLQQQLVDERRIGALHAIWKELNIEGIKQLIKETKSPWDVGRLLANTKFTKDIDAQVLDWLNGNDESLLLAAQAYVNSKYFANRGWLETIYADYKDKWEIKKWNNFCVRLPFIKDTFELIKKFPREVFDHYWQNVTGCYIQKDDVSYVSWTIQELLKHNRPFAAIDAAMMALHSAAKETGVDSELLATALEQAATSSSTEKPSSHIGYEITEAIKYLQANGDITTKRLASIEWMYIPMFSHRNVKPKTLIKDILEDPTFFVYLIRLIYKAEPVIENEFPEISKEQTSRLVQNAWRLLGLIHNIPGQDGPGGINKNVLLEWVTKVREECKQYNRADIGDHQIGQLLSHAPTGVDGIWPHEAVREILEKDGTQEIAVGIEIGRYNQRGMTSRALGTGGDLERKIVAEYEESANKISLDWPKTANLLRGMAGKYKRDAKRWDDEEKLEDD